VVIKRRRTKESMQANIQSSARERGGGLCVVRIARPEQRCNGGKGGQRKEDRGTFKRYEKVKSIKKGVAVDRVVHSSPGVHPLRAWRKS